jgi:hypothetical protein
MSYPSHGSRRLVLTAVEPRGGTLFLKFAYIALTSPVDHFTELPNGQCASDPALGGITDRTICSRLRFAGRTPTESSLRQGLLWSRGRARRG